MRKKITGITFVLFFLNFISRGQSVVQLLNKENGEPIPFAIIRVIGEPKGMVSNENGVFNIMPPYPTRLYISSVGFRDTTVVFQEETKIIFLNPKPILLPEVEVNDKKLNTILIGDLKTEGKIYKTNSGKEILNTIQPYLYFGVYIDKKVKKKARIGKIYFYVAKADSTEKLALRLLAGPDKFQSHKMYEMNDLTELLNSSIIVKDIIRGWNEIELSELGILYPPSGLFVFLHSLDDSQSKIGLSKPLNTSVANYPKDKSMRSIYFALVNDGTVVATTNHFAKDFLKPAIALVLDTFD